MLNDKEVLCDVPAHSSPEQPPTQIPIIAMEEVTPGRYWVLVNFPGRSSLSLATNADRELAVAIADAACAVSREARAYFSSRKEGAL